MEDQNSLSEPFLLLQNDDASGSSSSMASENNDGIVFRLVFLSLVATLAVWASHEASKGFHVTIVNALPRDSRAAKRFELFYVSNDKATRVLLNASDFVEDLLYGGGAGDNYDGTLKKPVSHVTLRLRLGGESFHGGVSVQSFGQESTGFVVDLSHNVLEESDVDRAVRSAVLRGMARVWLWDNGAPSEILSGVVEYIVMAAGFEGEGMALGSEDHSEVTIGCGRDHRNSSDWFADVDPRFVARLLGRCEEEERGFIRRLNRGMRGGWHDRTVDDALGKPAQLCLCVPDRNSTVRGY